MGMTGGQMAPTTLIIRRRHTCTVMVVIRICTAILKYHHLPPLISRAHARVTRQSVETVGVPYQAKKAIRKAFENSIYGQQGFFTR